MTVRKWIRLTRDTEDIARIYQAITVASDLWVQTYVRPHNCTPVLEILEVGETVPTLLWTGQDSNAEQSNGTSRVTVPSGTYDLLVGADDMEVGSYLDVLMLSAQTSLAPGASQLVPADDADGLSDAEWLAAWTAIDCTKSVITETINL